ncbi:5,6-dimethylbenzimidazole synthase [Sedimentitalea sp. HM32M-2]|uniref:5,6-dimethylbenzimidazole synthase n=1 Tax=Sedimentitalea sp. HM32M-2 TaxID=3351566 RepID=UPI00362C3CAB
MTVPGTEFDGDFRTQLNRLMQLRRDVRRFRSDPVDEAALARGLDAFALAPSVGLSEPWRLVRVDDPARRAAVQDNFSAANADALAGYDGEKAAAYGRLKLSGMDQAPVHLAVFCDDGTEKGSGLGAATMPEMRRYSVVCGITLMWLALRAQGLGLGWVSILDPDRLARDLQVPDSWRLIGYFCIGWPEAVSDTPELERQGWEQRHATLPLEVR